MAEKKSKLEKEYSCVIAALSRVGILTILPRSGKPGVTGIDGKEYPAPTKEQVKKAFARNKGLVARKMRQGFTRLQLTPIAMPVPKLIELLKKAVLKHSAEGKINRTKQKPAEADVPAQVNKEEQVWIWEKVCKALDTSKIVYFPKAYDASGHKGLTKKETILTKRLCAVPGWSIGLIEPIPVMPKQGKGKTRGGRKQLEANSNPHEYLRTLSTPAYEGETGWTPEDFLIQFITQLEMTNQVSHDRHDSNALWLLGAYIPDLMPKSGNKRYKMQLVPVGYWSSDTGRKMYFSAHRTGNRFRICVARTMVRLGV
ncbi:MAG: hypothetical protein EPN86_01870 [Nanoarchaeota archaeon]|nr:MAG: hypothetical protein EPN86_01870 [Nanoarchaeota archaeon]